MFWCLPLGDKCEWRQLWPFVKQYNEVRCTDYQLDRCLDVFDRTTSQPEILLKDEKAQPLAVERKAFPWPPDYIRIHELEHEFSEFFMSQVSGHFLGAAFMLELSAKHLPRTAREVWGLAQSVADLIVRRREEVLTTGEVRSQAPVPLLFRRLHEAELDEWMPRQGVGVTIQGEWQYLDGDDEKDPESQAGAMREQMIVLLRKVDAKFRDYLDCRCVCLIEPYSEEGGLDVDAAVAIFHVIDVPFSIDEIWIDDSLWGEDGSRKPMYKEVWHRVQTDC